MLLLFDLPIEEDAATEENTSKVKGIGFKKDKKKLIAMAIIGILIVVLSFSVGIIVMKKVPKNASPYCMLMKEEGKICKIHNKKHDTKKLSELVVPEDEMTLHEQLYQDVLNGAYFDGKRLYKKDDAKELLEIKDSFNQEIASLFERYLSDKLTEEEKKRYNFIKEELVTIDESIVKLEIKEEEKDELSEEELTDAIKSLNEQLSEVKLAKGTEVVSISTSVQEVSRDENKEINQEKVQKEKVQQEIQQESQQREDKLLYLSQTTRAVNIPKNIEKIATIKKSTLYN